MSTSSRVIDGLKSDYNYHFILRAKNNAGWSDLSDPVDHTTVHGETAGSAISVGTSPFLYQNFSGVLCHIIVQGGTVSKIELSKGGGTFYDVGLTAGMFTLSPNDYLKVTYSSTPNMTWIPV